jgi:L-malate glycosyltransferase
MKILHITPHLGQGVGTVVTGWMEKIDPRKQTVISLDFMNTKAASKLSKLGIDWYSSVGLQEIELYIKHSDIVLVHYWQHPMLMEFLKQELPPCRLVFWCHRNDPLIMEHVNYPDKFIVTSRVIGDGKYDVIWSTGGIDRFLNLKPIEHETFTIGYVGTIDLKKMHSKIFEMCRDIEYREPNVKFSFVGKVSNELNSTAYNGNFGTGNYGYGFYGKVDDVLPYFASMDVFGYPLRPDHYGTSEQVLGEAMASGVVPVCMDNPTERLIIKEGVTGFLCKTEQEYIDNIVHLYHKPELRKWMGENARNYARIIYNLDTMLDKWENVFNLLMKEPKRGHRL